MEVVEDVVIVGAGLAGLATAVGLYRKGVRSLVLESSESLRAAGFAFTTWTNAWRALDALGVGDSLRQQHSRLLGVVISSASSGVTTSSLSFSAQRNCGEHEVRCVRRNLLLETLKKELPPGTIRYSSKVVSIEDSGELKLLHLADGPTLKTKVLIGCDGVNSVIAQWLGLKKPSFTGRSSSRGLAEFPNGHGFKPELLQVFGEGFRSGIRPCDERSIYWFFNWTPSPQGKLTTLKVELFIIPNNLFLLDGYTCYPHGYLHYSFWVADKEVEESATRMKQFILSKLRFAKVPEEIIHVIEKTDMSGVVSSPLRYRWPFELLWGNISKGHVCVAGDALHPMTPDIGQGGCAALEDGIVLARCLGEALLGAHNGGTEGEHERIQKALKKYASERRWRSFELISTAYVLGYIQQSDGAIMSFLRDKCLTGLMAKMLLKRADFDCGKL